MTSSMELAALVDHVLIEGDQAGTCGWACWAHAAAANHLVAASPGLDHRSVAGDELAWRRLEEHGGSSNQSEGER